MFIFVEKKMMHFIKQAKSVRLLRKTVQTASITPKTLSPISIPLRTFKTCQTYLQTPLTPKTPQTPQTPKTTQKLGKMTAKYQIQYTCNAVVGENSEICGNRNIHEFSKHAYHNTVVICRCRKCNNNHVIADNLGWFTDLEGKRNIEEIMAEKGEEVVKASLEHSDGLSSDGEPNLLE